MNNPAAASNPEVSVVVPVFGGHAALPELARRVAGSMTAAGLSWELILVDDRGRTESWPVIRKLAADNPHIIGMRLSRNFGQHAATVCGIEQARGQWITTMDDDLEHPPEAIPDMLDAASEEVPVIYGNFPKRTHSGIRNFSSELMRWSLKRAFPDLNQDYSSFRVIHAPLAKQLVRLGINRPYIDGMLSWMTSSTRTVEVVHGERQHGESAYTWRRLLSHALNNFVTFSHLPLRIASYGGAALAFASFAYLLFVVFGYFTGQIQSPGYTSLMSVILLACGIQLLILGALGEYIGRLMGAAYRKPPYLVASRTDRAGQSNAIS